MRYVQTPDILGQLPRGIVPSQDNVVVSSTTDHRGERNTKWMLLSFRYKYLKNLLFESGHRQF